MMYGCSMNPLVDGRAGASCRRKLVIAICTPGCVRADLSRAAAHPTRCGDCGWRLPRHVLVSLACKRKGKSSTNDDALTALRQKELDDCSCAAPFAAFEDELSIVVSGNLRGDGQPEASSFWLRGEERLPRSIGDFRAYAFAAVIDDETQIAGR